MNWFLTSNRYKHFLYAIPASFLLTFFFGLGLATGMEFKDKMYGNKWDWIDWICTVCGSIIGGSLQILLIWILKT